MQTEGDLDHWDELIFKIWNKYGAPAMCRTLRAIGYGFCAFVLLAANTYPLGGFWSIVIAVGVLGAASTGARIGQITLAILMAMALFPYPVVSGALTFLAQ